jgi:DNA sulfur modification protein DndB
LTRSAFFEAIFEVLDEVVRNSMALHGNAKQESLQKVVRPLAQLDYSGAAGGRATPTKKTIVTTMQAALRKAILLSEEML